MLLAAPSGVPRQGADPEAVDKFCDYIDGWPGKGGNLKQVAKNTAKRTLGTSTVQALRDLRDAGHVTVDQFKAWEKLRNQVMHGGLVPPYSSAEGDKLLLDLSDLMHAVTRKVVSAS